MEGSNLPSAFNNSIYLMLGVPYSALLIFGFLIVRGAKGNRDYVDRLVNSQGSGPNDTAAT